MIAFSSTSDIYLFFIFARLVRVKQLLVIIITDNFSLFIFFLPRAHLFSLYYFVFPIFLNGIQEKQVFVRIIQDPKSKRLHALSPHLLESPSPSIPASRFFQTPIQPPAKPSRCPLESRTPDNMLSHGLLWTQVSHSRTLETMLGPLF